MNYFELRSGNDTRRESRAPTTKMQRGDVIKMVTGGGGGYGNPIERPVEEVLSEVIADYITPDQARDAYGVVVKGKEIDQEATDRLRSQMGV